MAAAHAVCGVSVHSQVSKNRPDRAGQCLAADLAGVLVDTQTVQPTNSMVGRAVEVGAPVTTHHHHTTNDNNVPFFVCGVDRLQALDYQPTAVLAGTD